jgi:hypothetical protein
MAQETGVYWGQEPVAFGTEVSFHAPEGRISEALADLQLEPA